MSLDKLNEDVIREIGFLLNPKSVCLLATTSKMFKRMFQNTVKNLPLCVCGNVAVEDKTEMICWECNKSLFCTPCGSFFTRGAERCTGVKHCGGVWCGDCFLQCKEEILFCSNCGKPCCGSCENEMIECENHFGPLCSWCMQSDYE